MERTNLFASLSKAVLDPVAGIRIARLCGDDVYAAYGTELAAHSGVTAHYHGTGLELYEIIRGKGRLHTGLVGADGKAAWKEPCAVAEGDVFAIGPREAHRLFNDSDEPLVFMFQCPATHLGADRHVVEA